MRLALGIFGALWIIFYIVVMSLRANISSALNGSARRGFIEMPWQLDQQAFMFVILAPTVVLIALLLIIKAIAKTRDR